MKREYPIRTLAVMAVLALGTAGCAAFKSSDNRSASSATPTAQRSAGQTASDAGITAKVKTAFAADDLVKAHRIDVDTVRGVVQLNGTVNSAAEKARAMQLAKRVEGVVDVKDNLKTAG